MRGRNRRAELQEELRQEGQAGLGLVSWNHSSWLRGTAAALLQLALGPGVLRAGGEWPECGSPRENMVRLLLSSGLVGLHLKGQPLGLLLTLSS